MSPLWAWAFARRGSRMELLLFAHSRGYRRFYQSRWPR